MLNKENEPYWRNLCHRDANGCVTCHFDHQRPCTPGDFEHTIWTDTFTSPRRRRPLGPENLLNLAGVEPAGFKADTSPPHVGDTVKLCFLLSRDAPWYKHVRRCARQNFHSEAMFVTITDVDGHGQNACYEGELLNMPMLIPAHVLTLGSKVRFTVAHILTDSTESSVAELKATNAEACLQHIA